MYESLCIFDRLFLFFIRLLQDVRLKALKSHSSAFLISRYILRLGQRRRCCFCAACPNPKMYLEIRSADEGAFNWPKTLLHDLFRCQDNLEIIADLDFINVSSQFFPLNELWIKKMPKFAELNML